MYKKITMFKKVLCLESIHEKILLACSSGPTVQAVSVKFCLCPKMVSKKFCPKNLFAILAKFSSCCCFPQAPFRETNVPGNASAGIIQLRNCTMASWGAVGDFVTPFVLEKLFEYSCSVELAGSYLGHVPCKFWKVCLGLEYLPQISYGGKLTCFGCSPRIGYHWYGLLVKWACSFCMT